MAKLETYLMWTFHLVVDNEESSAPSINEGSPKKRITAEQFEPIVAMFKHWRTAIEMTEGHDIVPDGIYEAARMIIDRLDDGRAFKGEQQLARYETQGDGFYGFRVMGVVKKHFDAPSGKWEVTDLGKYESIGNMACNMLGKLIEGVQRELNLHDPKRIADKLKMFEEFEEKVFDGNIPMGLIEEIPNGYCNQACCVMTPWYKVHTIFGPLIIGWRKRVISIDVTLMPLMAKVKLEELFKAEDTTKGDGIIHAWGYEKAREYVNEIINHQKAII